MIALISFLVMIVLMLFNVPIALCTGFAAITGIVMSTNINYMTFVQRLYVGMDSFTLIAVPLFMLCGRFMALGGITKDLIGLANRVETMVQDIPLDIKVAVMGCVVNGPGEAKEAAIGIAGGKGVGLLIKGGEIMRKVPEDQLLDELRKELLIMAEKNRE